MITGKIKIILLLAAVITVLAGSFYLKNLRQENSVLKLELKTANETLKRERAHWGLVSRAVTVASSIQSGICKTEMERRNLIDDISREAQASQAPKGAIDEKTNTKVLLMFNDNLFSPLGAGLRREKE